MGPAAEYLLYTGTDLRLDSVTRLYRLKGVMKYVLTKAYEKYPTYLEYRYDRSDAF